MRKHVLPGFSVVPQLFHPPVHFLVVVLDGLELVIIPQRHPFSLIFGITNESQVWTLILGTNINLVLFVISVTNTNTAIILLVLVPY